MRKLLSLFGLSLALSLGSAYAASPAAPAKPASAASPATPAAPKAKSTQQNKMKTCNKDAADKKLKGDERKAFMKACLSNKA
ncbi:PsiF family protein [Rhodoferax sp.]|uniref:PsiF family protein n=1 Tax=Rhodoferax sp. TaxID=50421 RepID=UPI0008C37987|nr:PsiF family protein [Rhodoferax sp.]MDO8319533.1 PsiF family protein [Rhodoferax sp.]MDP2678772.1 PsiF family protein [Rhodoferax sp.]OGB50870.1 MAG: hypothetical protein A2503_00700 [Burkholderiales bacterium RIFOXYD12_FULL_59_19]OGB81913.1 MAG: hypothetical protein A2535_09085 [Burkholderiales bacterium RIFOXYD2_FULL_59_8]